MLFDTHCHVYPKMFREDSKEVLERTIKKNVFMNLIGTQYETSKEAMVVAEKYDGVFASIGLHPTHLFPEYIEGEDVIDKTDEKDFDYKKYKKLTNSKKIIAIGECGLDVYRLPESADRNKVLKKQTEVFLKHAELARECNLPLVIHVRSAHKEMIEILKQEIEKNSIPKITGVIHCYDSNWMHAQEFINLGFYLGFTGIITFPPKKNNPQKQAELLEVIKNCPLDRILLETDAPFLAPLPYRGKQAEPWMVGEVAKKIAEIKRLNIEEVISESTNNAKDLFNLKI